MTTLPTTPITLNLPNRALAMLDQIVESNFTNRRVEITRMILSAYQQLNPTPKTPSKPLAMHVEPGDTPTELPPHIVAAGKLTIGKEEVTSCLRTLKVAARALADHKKTHKQVLKQDDDAKEAYYEKVRALRVAHLEALGAVYGAWKAIDTPELDVAVPKKLCGIPGFNSDAGYQRSKERLRAEVAYEDEQLKMQATYRNGAENNTATFTPEQMEVINRPLEHYAP